MKFIADFHVHSKYSRATAKDLDLERLSVAGQMKGVGVIGTGDFTHPEWFSEIKGKLEPDGTGLFKLKNEIEKPCRAQVPGSCRRDIRFMLVAEISNIYKKGDRTRKNHNLIFVPDFETAASFNRKLDKIGNIKSDGRPILGLDARDLLEILLETSQESFLIPAHIWTPWFSLLGSKSGFDSINECFEDLEKYIFAVETGLSSDPAMNWRVTSLDGLTLISNSDAHSPSKLAREANIFDTEISFVDIKSALRTGDTERFLGTIEFFPEEGKYHLDGHRKCHFSSWPAETNKHNGICPVCGKPLTLGVLYRVEQLADRPVGQKPKQHHPYFNIIPLQEVLSELLSVGPNSKKVNQAYSGLLERFGSELDILYHLPLEVFHDARMPLLKEAIRRIRNRQIQITPGFDGEFGRIQLFEPQEKSFLLGQKTLFTVPNNAAFPGIKEKPSGEFNEKQREKIGKPINSGKENKKGHTCNDQQKKVVAHDEGPIIVVAGPGTGKTWTITRRIAHLVNKKEIDPQNILALTFTNKAADEMVERLKMFLPNRKITPRATTFHSFCLGFLEATMPQAKGVVIDDNEKKYYISEAKRLAEKNRGRKISVKISELMNHLDQMRQKFNTPASQFSDRNKGFRSEIEAVCFFYKDLLAMQGLWDYEDLIQEAAALLEKNPEIRRQLQDRYTYFFIDEYQDINQGQYRIIKSIAPQEKNICVIGDPDQSIYAFRGSDVRYFKQFSKDYPKAEVVYLRKNYRSTQIILDASRIMLYRNKAKTFDGRLLAVNRGKDKIQLVECADEKNEAVFIGKKIEALVGGVGFYSIDFGKTDSHGLKKERSFSDIAVLYRTSKQGKFMADVLMDAGIPCQVASKEDFFYDPSVQVVISMLKLMEKKGSFVDFEKINHLVAQGIDKKTMETWKQWAYEKRFSFEQALSNIRKFPLREIQKEQQARFDVFARKLNEFREKTDQLTLKDKITCILQKISLGLGQNISPPAEDPLLELHNRVEPYGNDCQRFLKSQALQTDTDCYHREAEKVSLMTMHASKGLEFSVVFIAGCEDGLIPHRRSRETALENEERRLFYVAMTRAKELLYLTFSKNRNRYGKNEPRKPSPFLADIEKRFTVTISSETDKTHPKKHRQLQLF